MTPALPSRMKIPDAAAHAFYAAHGSAPFDDEHNRILVGLNAALEHIWKEVVERAALACELRAALSRNEALETDRGEIYDLRMLRVDEALRCAEAIRLLTDERIESSIDKLETRVRELEFAEAEAMALVVSHEGHIEKLEAYIRNLEQSCTDRDNAFTRRLMEQTIANAKLLDQTNLRARREEAEAAVQLYEELTAEHQRAPVEIARILKEIARILKMRVRALYPEAN